MARLIYGMQTSLDGYTADAAGNFDWAEPNEEIHRFVNDNDRPTGTYLYGRRMYETMLFWETAGTGGDSAAPDYIRDYAELWRNADKVVYSTTLDKVDTTRTRIERTFDPPQVRKLKASAQGQLIIDGPALAAQALHAWLVDELRQYVYPVVVGAGTRFLPDGLQLNLELVETHPFSNGTVYLRYRVPPS